MILKLVGKGKVNEAFIDGFSYVNTAILTKEEANKHGYCCPTSAYTCADDERIMRLELCNETNELVRVVLVGSCYDVYLMSNEGKTIERIN